MWKLESPTKIFEEWKSRIKREWKTAFFACFLTGLLVHMPVLLSDIPNHDGLDSMYFDQNMITSGRWFLTVACGFSSYYTIPWVIGILGLFYLGCAAAAVCELLEVRKAWAAAACGSLMAAFPALTSTFAYVFTLDGYMLAVLLAVLAVLFTKKKRMGFVPGAVCLAFSMGIYQAYLSVAMILSLFALLMLFAGDEREERQGKASGKGGRNVPKIRAFRKGGGSSSGGRLGEKLREALRYLYMGGMGAGLYYGLLQLLLKIQGKELAGYQGIDGMVSGEASRSGLAAAIVGMYRDFLGFTFRGNVLCQNVFSGAALLLLGISGAAAAVLLLRDRKSWKKPGVLVIMGLAAAGLPAAANVILLVSPSVTYHLLMRFQWVLFLIGAVALAGSQEGKSSARAGILAEWGACLGAFVLVFCFAVTDNIAYSNLQKRYEKTYAYCVRLLDRIEQTEGYYPGIPVAMVGVVGDEQFPPTDLTQDVTSGMIGMNGDSLLYRGDNYREFIKNYLGATLNILPPEAMEEMYYSEEYISMDSFPGRDSVRIIDGIMYIKTENFSRQTPKE